MIPKALKLKSTLRPIAGNGPLRFWRGGIYYIKFVRYYNGIRRLGGGGFITLTPCVPRYALSISPAVFNQPNSRRPLSLLSINGLPSIANIPYICYTHKFFRSKTNRYWVSCKVSLLLKRFFLNTGILYVQPILFLETWEHFSFKWNGWPSVFHCVWKQFLRISRFRTGSNNFVNSEDEI